METAELQGTYDLPDIEELRKLPAGEILSMIDYRLELLADARRVSIENDEALERRVVMLRASFEEANRVPEGAITNHMIAIETLAQFVVYEKGKKSRKLGHGTFGSRKTKATVEINNETALKGWAAIHLPQALRPSKSVSVAKRPIVAYIKGGGETPDGATFVDEHDTFYVSGR